MKFEDLKVGMVIESIESMQTKVKRKIIAIATKTYIYVEADGCLEILGHERNLYAFQEYKSKKRYWLWDVKPEYCNIYKSTQYMDETGFNTLGKEEYKKSSLFRKHETEFIDV